MDQKGEKVWHPDLVCGLYLLINFHNRQLCYTLGKPILVFSHSSLGIDLHQNIVNGHTSKIDKGLSFAFYLKIMSNESLSG